MHSQMWVHPQEMESLQKTHGARRCSLIMHNLINCCIQTELNCSIFPQAQQSGTKPCQIWVSCVLIPLGGACGHFLSNLEWEITLSAYQWLLELDQRMFAVPWSSVVPDLEANSFPAMISSVPCSCMESLSLDLLVFLSILCSDLALIQENAAKEICGILSSVDWKSWRKCCLWKKEMIYTFLGQVLCVCLCVPFPKCAVVFHFDILKEAFQLHLSESVLGFSLLKCDLYFRKDVKKKNQWSPDKINLLVLV